LQDQLGGDWDDRRMFIEVDVDLRRFDIARSTLDLA
jgi:hypothetical protein